MKIEKIGFGGGCHWCTEAVFSSLIGVSKVEQGWIASEKPFDSLSEAVIVHFDPGIIGLEILIEIHLRTHSSKSDHSMRVKYRSAVYTFSQEQNNTVVDYLSILTAKEGSFATQVLPFESFKASSESYQDYYIRNKDKPFCKTYIDPKLKLVRERFKKTNPAFILENET